MISYHEVLEEFEKNQSGLEDLICNALEGGSNYWYTIIDIEDATEYSPFTHLIPFRGGSLTICDIEEFDEETGTAEESWRLDKESLLKGYSLFAFSPKHRHHFTNFLQENDDAETSDVFLQLCLFGKIVYS